MDNELITSEWLLSKGFQLTMKGSCEYWQRVDNEGYFLDMLVFRRYNISTYGLIGLDKGNYFQSILQNNKKIFYIWELKQIYKILGDIEL